MIARSRLHVRIEKTYTRIIRCKEAKSLMTQLRSCSGVPIDIGSRLELMVDDFLIARLGGGAALRLNRPVPREAALVTDRPWEGNACTSFTIFQDGEIYRMYYLGRQFETTEAGLDEGPHPDFVCYAESSDGIHWVRPELGLVEFNGSSRNNIILSSRDSACPVRAFAPFKDANPAAEPDARYKAWAVRIPRLDGSAPRPGHGAEVPDGLHPLKSADGINWTPMSGKPVIADGLLDSQNLAFWDTVRGEYRDYHRNEFRIAKTGEEPYASQEQRGAQSTTVRGSRYGRDLRTATSADFIHWSEPHYVNYTQGRTDEIYNNAITPYFRAPHIFVGLPTRYVDHGWSEAVEDLPELKERRRRAAVSERYGSALTDGMFMSSRDGQTFNLWPESFLRPGLRPQDNWVYGDGFPSWGMVTTPSAIGGAPDELSIYTTEGYWRGESINLRRYTLRVDGFASVQAPLSGGELVTKPLLFSGNQLRINFSASAAGSVQVELLRDQMNTPIEGFSLDDCIEVLGDDLGRVVRWSGGSDVGRLAGIPIRLRFLLRDADLFAFQFVTI